MKKIVLSIFTFAVLSCSTKNKTTENSLKQHTFLLEDDGDSKFQLIEPIKAAYAEGNFINSPVVAIDGIVFKYNKAQDTIVLPLKKNEITNILYLVKESSAVIYGKKETNGAIIINTSN
jgi:hypothetical protein